MRTNRHTALATLVSTALLSSAALVLSGCASPDVVEQEQTYQIPGGVAVVDTLTTYGTITAIDANKRKVTFTMADGKSQTFKVHKDVDLSSLQIGQQIGLLVTEEAALAIQPKGTPPSQAVAVQLAAATNGQAGAAFEGEAVEVTAVITAIDMQTRKVTFRLADGTTKTLKAQSKANLSKVRVGDSVMVEIAESAVIATSRP